MAASQKESMRELLERITAENRELKEVQKRYQKAIREASLRRHAVVVMEPGRQYAEEIRALILEKTKGLADPSFEVRGKEIVVSFGDIGPRYKLKIAGPLKRLRSKVADSPRSL